MKLLKTIKFSRNRLISRRQALRIGIGAIITTAILLTNNFKVLSYLFHTLENRNKIKNSKQRTFQVVGKNSLKQRARAKGLIYGAFPQADRQNFDKNLKFKSSFIRECDMVVAGFYWNKTQPTASNFDFRGTDYFAKFASTNKMLLRGHPLVWHLSLPQWLEEKLDHQNAKNILTNHLQTIVKRYAGKMHSWDVVNEGLELKNGRSELRKDVWLKFVGSDYIELAFRTVARLDPTALLVYNETDLEYSEVHQTAVLKLLEQLQSKGTPIHALGIQSHLISYRDDFNPRKFAKFLKNVADLGLKIMITELDVVDKHLPRDTNQRDRIVAGIYEDYLNAVLAEKSVTTVINWGLSDRYSWLSEFVPREDLAPVRPLPLDREMKPKLAWNAIARSFDRAPKR